MRARDGVLFLLCLIVLFAASGCDYNTATAEDDRKDPYVIKGKDQLARRDIGGAEESFMLALERNPRNGAAHYELGILSEEAKQDYVGAIYHYQRYLQLAEPKSDDPVIRGRVTACKRALVTQSGITPDGTALERQLEQVVANNKNLEISLKRLNEAHESLKRENSQLRSLLMERDAALKQAQSLIASGALSPQQSAPAAPVQPSPGAVELKKIQPSTSALVPANKAPRIQTYKIEEGDNFGKIATKLNLKAKDIIDLNPNVDPRKLQIGQEIKIPVQ